MTAHITRWGLLLATFAVSITAFGADSADQPKPQRSAAAASDGGDKEAKDSTPRRSPAEEILTINAMLAENAFRWAMVRQAGLSSDRFELGNRWAQIELRAFRKQVADLAKDLKTIRDLEERLEKQRRLILSVLNGKNSASGQTAFVKAMLQSKPSNDMIGLLGMHVSPIGAEHFNAEADSVIATTLQRDGTLVAPPGILVGTSETQGIGRHAYKFQAAWNVIVEQMRDGNPVSVDQTNRLEAAFAKWQAAAQPLLVLEETPCLDRALGKRYLQRMSGLVAKVKYSERAEEVAFWIRGTGFEGGTVGDLVQYLADHRLTLRSGCEPHRALQQVGHLWVEELDSQIGDLKVAKQKMIDANPATHAALKSTVEQQSSSTPSGKDLASAKTR